MITAFYAPPAEVKAKASIYAWALFGIACAILIATLLQQWAFAVMGQALARRVRGALFGALLRQEIAFFDDDGHASGKLAALLAADAAAVRGAVGDVFGATVQNLAVLVAGYAIAVRLSLPLSVSPLSFSLVLSVAVLLLFRTNNTHQQHHNNTAVMLHSLLTTGAWRSS